MISNIYNNSHRNHMGACRTSESKIYRGWGQLFTGVGTGPGQYRRHEAETLPDRGVRNLHGAETPPDSGVRNLHGVGKDIYR